MTISTAIIAYLLIQITLRFFFTTDRSVFYCGIAAFAPIKNITSEQSKLAVMKMKMLGLYNKSRGQHSCGMYIGDTLVKGVDKLKAFDDFIENTYLPAPINGHVIMLHTRHATRGVHSVDNSHPFHIESPNGDIIFEHNGTIDNTYTLCTKYKIEHSYTEVDSKILGKLLAQEGVKVLEEYKGAAALVWTKLDEPNSLYVYHGKGPKVKNGPDIEERPMFFMRTSEGIYFSSLYESLCAICDEDDQYPEELEHNFVFKITNGKFTSSKKFIDRSEINIPSYTTYTSPTSIGGTSCQTTFPFPSQNMVRESLIWRETVPPRAEKIKNCIYFHKGRYHNQDGNLVNGKFYLSKKGEITDSTYGSAFFFWEGAMISTEDKYNKLLQLALAPKSWVNQKSEYNYAMCLSEYSSYPLTCYDDGEGAEMSELYRYAFYFAGNRCKASFTPKFSSRHYVISPQGYLLEIKTSDKNNDKKVVYDTMAEAIKANSNNIMSLLPIIVNPFDKIFDDYDTMIESFSDKQMAALISFVKNYSLAGDFDINTDDEAYLTLITAMRTAIKTQSSIRDVLDDNNHYLEVLCDDPKILDNLFNEDKETPKAIFDFSEELGTYEKDDDQFETLMELDEAEEEITSLIIDIKEMRSTADTIQANPTDLAQDVAYETYKATDILIGKLKAICEKHKLPLIQTELNKINNNGTL